MHKFEFFKILSKRCKFESIKTILELILDTRMDENNLYESIWIENEWEWWILEWNQVWSNRLLVREREPECWMKREEEQWKITPETRFPVCTNRNSGCDQKLETMKTDCRMSWTGIPVGSNKSFTQNRFSGWHEPACRLDPEDTKFRMLPRCSSNSEFRMDRTGNPVWSSKRSLWIRLSGFANR